MGCDVLTFEIYVIFLVMIYFICYKYILSVCKNILLSSYHHSGNNSHCILYHNSEQVDHRVGEGGPDADAHDEHGDHQAGDPLLLLGAVARLRPQHHAQVAQVAVGHGEHQHQRVVVRVCAEENWQIPDVWSSVAEHEEGDEN